MKNMTPCIILAFITLSAAAANAQVPFPPLNPKTPCYTNDTGKMNCGVLTVSVNGTYLNDGGSAFGFSGLLNGIGSINCLGTLDGNVQFTNIPNSIGSQATYSVTCTTQPALSPYTLSGGGSMTCGGFGSWNWNASGTISVQNGVTGTITRTSLSTIPPGQHYQQTCTVQGSVTLTP